MCFINKLPRARITKEKLERKERKKVPQDVLGVLKKLPLCDQESDNGKTECEIIKPSLHKAQGDETLSANWETSAFFQTDMPRFVVRSSKPSLTFQCQRVGNQSIYNHNSFNKVSQEFWRENVRVGSANGEKKSRRKHKNLVMCWLRGLLWNLAKQILSTNTVRFTASGH